MPIGYAWHMRTKLPLDCPIYFRLNTHVDGIANDKTSFSLGHCPACLMTPTGAWMEGWRANNKAQVAATS